MTETQQPPEQWAFGAALAKARGHLSVRAAAKRAGISEGRWRQLEDGYQRMGDTYVPARPRAATVVAVARALDIDVGEALAAAGLDPEMAPSGDLPGNNGPDWSDGEQLSPADETVLMHIPAGALAGLGPAERAEAIAKAKATILQTAREIRRQLDQ